MTHRLPPNKPFRGLLIGLLLSLPIWALIIWLVTR